MHARDQGREPARQPIFYRPAIPLLSALIGGILIADRVTGCGWAATAVALAGLAVVLWRLQRGRACAWAPLALFLALGYLLFLPWSSPRLPSNHISAYLDTGPWEITGEVTQGSPASGGRNRFVLRVEKLAAGGTIRPVVGKLRLTVYGQGPNPAAGERVAFSARIRSVHNFNNPGGFDFRRYLAFQGIHAISSVSGKHLRVIGRHPPGRLKTWSNAYRSSMSELIDRVGDSPRSAVLKALILGDRSAVGPGLREKFNRAGVSHILAISGLHIGIIATVGFLIFRKLLGFARPLLWRAWTRKGAALLALIPVMAYGWISGWSPSTQRAVLMVAVFLLGFLCERDADPLNSIALAALLILILHPPALFSISFQLSFAAVVTIVVGMTRFSELSPRRTLTGQRPSRVRTLADWLLKSFMVSLFAVWGTLPLVMVYFNQFSLAGLFTNLVIIPLIGFTVVPLGITALFCLPLTAAAASLCLMIADLLLVPAMELIDLVAAVPFLSFRTITPSGLEIFLFFAFTLALFYLVQTDAPVNPAPSTRRRLPRGRLRLRPAAVVVLAVVFSAGCADAAYWFYQRFWQRELRVTAIDVGQGTASLLEMPGGYTMLIDGGGFSDNSVFDVGAGIIAPYLWRQKIRSIDLLVLSHPNSDHLNGLLFIAEHFNVKELWTNGEPRRTFGYRELMRIARENRIHRPEFPELPRRRRINGVLLEMLYPPRDFNGRRKVEKWRDSNNNSMVLRVSLGRHSFLFPGDIMRRAEQELVALRGTRVQSTVLMAPHHGSRSSSCRSFLEAVAPRMVVISAGWQNRFGFPHANVLKRYISRGCRLWRTDRNGAVLFRTDGSELTAKAFVVDDPPRLADRGLDSG
jgi:competence protein ComEC